MLPREEEEETEEPRTFSMRRSARRSADPAGSYPWRFKVRYANQSDPYYIEKSDNFHLKYQMEFDSDVPIEAEKIEIRIPKYLLTDRNGQGVSWSQIAVPHETDDRQGSTPFKYREVGDELVFFNSQPVEAGVNIIWQVLYKDVNVMQITDMTEWELQPEVSVTLTEEGEGEEEKPEEIVQTLGKDEGLTALTGLVNTYVQLNSVSKSLYNEQYKNYTPGLYTESQVRSYITGALPPQFSGENFSRYRYVVWEVSLKGTATQPWNLLVTERPTTADGTRGYVVGYRDYSREAQGYNIRLKDTVLGALPQTAEGAVEDTVTLLSGYGTGEGEAGAWGSRFYVVTAYPMDHAPVKSSLFNQIDVQMVPADPQGESVRQSKTSAWKECENYEWTYIGNKIRINKQYRDDRFHNKYSGWLNVYRSAAKAGLDYGDFPFTTTTSFQGYDWTHAVQDKDGNMNHPELIPGSRVAGRSCKLTATDDTMYAYIGDETHKTLLGPQDYFLTDITVKQTDRDYDIYEDREIVPGSGEDPERGTGTLQIWVMYGEDENGAQISNSSALNPNQAGKWELLWEGGLDTGDTLTKSFHFEDTAARKPWRVKAEYVTANYRTVCQLDVRVRLRKDAPALAAVRAENSPVTYVKLEDISGVLGEYLEEGKNPIPVYMGDERDISPDPGRPSVNYGNHTELAEITRKLYGGLLCRTSDAKELTGLQEKAEAFKYSDSTNDAGRVLVDYYLTAYDGYELYSQDAVSWLKEGGTLTPGQNHVVFYDLLPYGMRYDLTCLPVAGRITALDAKRNYQKKSGLWDPSDVRVVVDPDQDIDLDYEGTGRTRIAFHVYYDGEDPAVYTEGMWMEGFGVHFRAYYEKKDLQIAQEGANVCAFMPGDSRKSLLGVHDRDVFLDNGTKYPGDFKPEDKALGADINGDGQEDVANGIYNVLYARATAKEDIVQEGQTGIVKKVRADADAVGGSFQTAASTAIGAGYAYEITVGNSFADDAVLTNIVVYDWLEKDAPDELRGTFCSVVTTALSRMGIDPVVYYSAEKDAARPEGDDLANSTDWTAKEDWEQSGRALSEVRAVAVDMRRAENGDDYQLNQLQNLSFQIRMQAPLTAKEGESVHNRAKYYAQRMTTESVPVENESPETTLTFAPARRVEVIKELTGEVPAQAESAAFEFRLYELQKDGGKNYLGDRQYTLEEWTADGRWQPKDDGNLHGTDKDGYFTLHAGEKAVFYYTGVQDPGAEEQDRLKIYAEETNAVFWDSTYKIVDNSNAENGSRKITFTNKYRPVVYVQKRTEGVPGDLEAEKAEQTFTFRLRTEAADGTMQNAADVAWYYVDDAGLYGGVPGPDPAHGTELTGGRTGEDGTFEIKKGDIIALCFDQVGLRYEISEVVADEESGLDASGDWILQSGAQTGETSVQGSRAQITNVYRWKDLYLTKRITHQEAADYVNKAFTFHISRKSEDGERWESLSPEEQGRIQWKLRQEEEFHALAADGTITSACGGQTIVIRGLEAGASYRVTETDDPDYAEGEATAVMPTVGDRVSRTITNDYLYRPLSVTKTVVYDPDMDYTEEQKNAAFPMQATVDGQPLGNRSYTLLYQGAEVPLEAGETRMTDREGRFSLKNGQTAVFKDAGKLEAAYEVKELANDTGFTQIYPADGGSESGNIAGEGAQASFVNGAAGNLCLRKSYVTADDDTIAKAYLRHKTLQVYYDYERKDGAVVTPGWKEDEGRYVKSSLAVRVTLELNGVPFTEPCEISLIDKNGNVHAEQWPDPGEESLDGTYLLEPDTTVVIPASVLEDYADPETGALSYELTEAAEDQHQVEYYEYRTRPASRIVVPCLIEISQKMPGNDGSAAGTLERNPVADLVNEAGSHEIRSRISKAMTWNSDEVPMDRPLIWRVEEKTAEGWVPATREISYVVFSGPADDPVLSSGQIEKTGAGGRLRPLYRTEYGYPGVMFPEDQVWLDRTDGAAGSLRLVEVMEESDPAWGMLAGYRGGQLDTTNLPLDTGSADAQAASKSVVRSEAVRNRTAEESAAAGSDQGGKAGRAGDDTAGLAPSDTTRDPSGTTGCSLSVGNPAVNGEGMVYVMNTFVNSNRTIPVEIAKEMENGAKERFTMVLKQVLLLKDDLQDQYQTNLTGVSPEDILLSEGRSGIPYEVYRMDDPQAETPVRSAATGAGGTLELAPGEFARFQLPEGTLWTVTENEKATSELIDVKGDPDVPGRLAKLGSDGKTMLVYQTQTAAPAEVVPKELRILQTDELVHPKDVVKTGADGTLRYEFDPFERNLEVYGVYSDGSSRVLKKGEFSVTVNWTPESLQEMREGLLEGDLNCTISWGEMEELVTLHYAPYDKQVELVRGAPSTGYDYDVPERLDISEIDVLYGLDNGIKTLIKLENRAVTLPRYFKTSDEENAEIYQLVRIGYRAFSGNTTLKAVVVPEGVTIGSQSFMNCTTLETVTIKGAPNDMDPTIGAYAFKDCSKLTTVQQSQYLSIIPEGITEIGNSAFEGSKLERIAVPKSVTKIGNRAFYGCSNLTDVRLQEGLASIGQLAFYKCGFSSITIPSTVTEIKVSTFYMCTALSNVTLQEGLNSIGSYAFSGCGLSSITIPSTVTVIGNYTFLQCKQLTKIEVKKEKGSIEGAPWGASVNPTWTSQP